MKLYWALVLPVLMYGSECWTLWMEDERRLGAYWWQKWREVSEVEAEESEIRRQEKNLEWRKR